MSAGKQSVPADRYHVMTALPRCDRLRFAEFSCEQIVECPEGCSDQSSQHSDYSSFL